MKTIFSVFIFFPLCFSFTSTRDYIVFWVKKKLLHDILPLNTNI